MMVITDIMVSCGIISLGLGEQRHKHHFSTTEGLAGELLKRVMCWVIEGIKGGWYPSKNRNGNWKQHAEQQSHQYWNRNRNRNRNRKTNHTITNLIRKAFRRNSPSNLQPSWGSILPHSILSNTPLAINSDKNHENTKKMSDNEDSDHGGSSLGKQRAKDTGKDTTQTTTAKQHYPEQLTSALSLFPLPHQMGAPYFDGTDVTDFIIQWADLTMDWADGLRIKKVPLYCEKMVGRYVKTLESYIDGNSWEDFAAELKAEYKDDDTEQNEIRRLFCKPETG